MKIKANKIISLLFVLFFFIGCFPPTVVEAAVTKSDDILEYWIENVEMPVYNGGATYDNYANVSLHFLNSVGTSNALYCLNKGTAAKDSVLNLARGDNFKKTDFWNLELNDIQRNGVQVASIYGAPHNTDDFGVTMTSYISGQSGKPIRGWEKIYATQVLMWEFTTGCRTNFTAGYSGMTDYWKNAFIVKEGSASSYTDTKKLDLTAAKSYYNALVNACKNHTTVTKLGGKEFACTNLGKNVFESDYFIGCSVKSSDTSIATVSISGNKLTVTLNKAIKNSGKLKLSLVKDITVVEDSSDEVPVMVNYSGAGQEMMYGTISDPQGADIYLTTNAVKGGFKLTKQDADGNGVPNVLFGLYLDSACKTKSTSTSDKWHSLVTKSDGTYSTGFTWPAGQTYYFKEIGWYEDGTYYLLASALNSSEYSGTTYTGPSLAALSDSATIEVVPSNATQGGWVSPNGKTYRVSGTVGSVTIAQSTTDLTPVKFGSTAYLTNNMAYGAVGIIKSDESGNPLSGVKFGVWTNKTDALAKDTSASSYKGTVTTNANGMALYGTTNVKRGNFTLSVGDSYYFAETTTLAGYILDEGAYGVTVNPDRIQFAKCGTSSVGSIILYKTYQNTYSNNGGLRIIYRSGTGDYVSGKTVTIYSDAACTTKVKSLTTGTSALNYYGENASTLAESTLGNGGTLCYIKVSGEKEVYPIAVYGNTISNLYITQNSELINEKAGGLSIKKYYQNTSVPIEGFNFDVFNLSTCTAESKVATITTDANGVAYYGGNSASTYSLKDGDTYYFKESASQNSSVTYGVKIDTATVYSATVVKSTTTNASQVIDDVELYGAIGVLKVDSKGNPLSGVTFGVYFDADCTNEVASITTSSSGRAIYNGSGTNSTAREDMKLVSGTTYYLKEKSVPSGHSLSTAKHSVTVSGSRIKFAKSGASYNGYIDYNLNTKLVNENYGGIVLKVWDSTTQTPSIGAKFKVYETADDAADGVNALTTLTTDANGEAKYYGTGSSLETSTLAAKHAYFLVQITPGQISGTTAVNDNTVYSFFVYKNAETELAVVTGTSDSSTGLVVNQRVGAIQVKKVDQNGNGLNGAVFGFYSDSACTRLIKSVTTASVGGVNGVINFYGTGTSLETSTLNESDVVYVKEISAPTGYTLDTPNATAVTIAFNHTTVINRTNKQNSGVRITKQDDVGNKLAGVQFTIYSDASCSVALATVTTDSNGYAYYYGTGTSLATSTLSAGTTLYIKETKGLTGYKMDTDVYSVTTESGVTSTTLKRVSDSGNVTVITNTRNGALKIKKTDDAGNVLTGVKFYVYSDSSCSAFVGATTATDSSGYAYFYGTGTSLATSSLNAGTKLYLKELASTTPEGYQRSANTFSVTIAAGVVTEANQVCVNTRYGGIAFQKIDADTGEGLNGATFKLYGTNADATADTNAIATVTSATVNSEAGWVTYGCNGKLTGYTQSDLSLQAGKTYYIRETAAPSGYLLDGEVNVYAIKVVAGTVTSEDDFITNSKSRNLTIKKVDQNGTGLSGAKFTVYSDASCSTVVIPEFSVAKTKVFKEAEFDTYFTVGQTYYVKETTGIAGYQQDTTVKSFTVTAGKTSYALTFTNIQNSGIKITKQDDIGNKLSGVEFNIYSDSGCTAVIGTVTTDANGVAYYFGTGTSLATSTLAPNQTIYFKEMGSLAGYRKDSSPYSVQTVSGEIVSSYTRVLDSTVRNAVINKRNSGIKIVKEDDAGNKLAGVEFTLYSNASCTSVVAVLTTDSNGTASYFGTGTSLATSTLFSDKTYYLKETKGLDGYDLDKNIYSVTTVSGAISTAFVNVTSSETTSVFVNTRKGSVAIRKLDDANKYVAGAVFGVYKTLADVQANTNQVTTLTTSASSVSATSSLNANAVYGGTASETKTLSAGTTYYFKELTAPKGHKISADILTATVVAGEVTLAHNVNDVSKNEVVNERYGGIKIEKVLSPDNTPLSGIRFKVYDNATDANSDTNVLATVTTDASGFAYYGGLGTDASPFTLEYGRKLYFAEDISSIPAYAYLNAKNVRTVFAVTVGTRGGFTVEKVTNYERGDVVVTKIPAADGIGTGWTFSLTGVSGTDTAGLSYTSFVYSYDSTLKKHIYTCSNVIPGKYTLTETNLTSKYVQPKSQTVTVTSGGRVIRGTATETSITNILSSGELKIIKTVNTGSPNGFEFRVKGIDENTNGFDSVFSTSTVDSVDGIIIVKDLVPGKYEVTENTPDGWRCVSTNPQIVTVTSSNMVTVGPFVNEYNGYLIVKKVDTKSNELANAVFGIYSDSACENIICQITTGNNESHPGWAVYGLDETDYPTVPVGTVVYVKELTAPDGYVKSEVIQKVTIASGENSITVSNTERGGLYILKLDATTGQKLSGAVFAVYLTKADADAQTNVYTTLSPTDENGIACFGTSSATGYVQSDLELIPGTTYWFREITAPEGYALSTKPVSETVVSGKVLEIEITNTLKSFRIYKHDMLGFPGVGVKFRVYTSNEDALARGDNHIAELTVNKEGYAVYEGFGDDVYYIIEYDSNGYLRSDKVCILNGLNYENSTDVFDVEVNNNYVVATGVFETLDGIGEILGFTVITLGGGYTLMRQMNKKKKDEDSSEK